MRKKMLNITGSGNTLFKSATYLQKSPLFEVINQAQTERIDNKRADRNRNFMGDWL